MPTANHFRRIALVLAAAFALAVTSVSSDDRPNIEDMISSAKTAADHEAVAVRYDEEAAAAKAKAEKHQAMLERYLKLGGPYVTKWHVDHHCQALAKAYRKAAEESAQLAEAHRAMAK